MKIYSSSEKTGSPLSGAYEVNGLVFVSGQVHLNKDKKLEGETIEEQFEIAIGNVQAILQEAELTLKNVIRVQLYLTDLTQLPSLNQIYPKYFDQPLPARTAIGVAALPVGASIEIDVVASREERSSQ